MTRADRPKAPRTAVVQAGAFAEDVCVGRRNRPVTGY